MNRILSLQISEIPETCKGLKEKLILPEGKNSYSSPGYCQETLCADKLLNKCKLRDTIRQDQFIGTNNSEQKYDSITMNPSNSWKNLNLKIDKSLKHTYERYRHAFEPDWFEQHRTEIVGNLEEIHSMLDECATNEKQINLTL